MLPRRCFALFCFLYVVAVPAGAMLKYVDGCGLEFRHHTRAELKTQTRDGGALFMDSHQLLRGGTTGPDITDPPRKHSFARAESPPPEPPAASAPAAPSSPRQAQGEETPPADV